MIKPSQEELAALGLDDASSEAAWQWALDAIRADGGDPDAEIKRAAEALEYYRNNPAPITSRSAVFLDDDGDLIFPDAIVTTKVGRFGSVVAASPLEIDLDNERIVQ